MATPGPGSWSPDQTPDSYESMATLGLWTTIAGSALQTVGSYYSVKSQANTMKSQALSLEHQASMSAINARAAEQDAQAITEAGQQQIGQVSAQYGQVKATERASTAARGIQAGVGSASEVQASIELAKQTDIYTINSNAVRAASAARTGAVNARNEALLAGVSATNMRKTAGSLDPYAAAGGSLLTGASGISQQWLARSRYRNRTRYAT